MAFFKLKILNVHCIKRQTKTDLGPVHYIKSHLCSMESISPKIERFNILRYTLHMYMYIES